MSSSSTETPIFLDSDEADWVDAVMGKDAEPFRWHMSHPSPTSSLQKKRKELDWHTRCSSVTHLIVRCFDEDKLVILFNGFQKKSQKTSQGEIEKAKRIISSGFKNKCPFLDTLLFGNGHSCYGIEWRRKEVNGNLMTCIPFWTTIKTQDQQWWLHPCWSQWVPCLQGCSWDEWCLIWYLNGKRL